MNFDVFYKKTLCLDKTVITFAYEVRLKSFLYEKVSTQKVTFEFNEFYKLYVSTQKVGLKSFLYEIVSTVVSTNFRISKFKRENRLFRTFIFSNLYFYFYF
jgi:hypothetical protein